MCERERERELSTQTRLDEPQPDFGISPYERGVAVRKESGSGGWWMVVRVDGVDEVEEEQEEDGEGWWWRWMAEKNRSQGACDKALMHDSCCTGT